jgi:hypothetical protein
MLFYPSFAVIFFVNSHNQKGIGRPILLHVYTLPFNNLISNSNLIPTDTTLYDRLSIPKIDHHLGSTSLVRF